MGTNVGFAVGQRDGEYEGLALGLKDGVLVVGANEGNWLGDGDGWSVVGSTDGA